MDPITPKRPRRASSFRHDVPQSPAALQKGISLQEQTPLKLESRVSRNQIQEDPLIPVKKGDCQPQRFEPIVEEAGFEGIQIDDREEVEDDDVNGNEVEKACLSTSQAEPTSASSDIASAISHQQESRPMEIEINGAKYVVRDAAAFNACLSNIAVPSPTAAPKRKQARQRSLDDFRRRRLEEKQAEQSASADTGVTLPTGMLSEGVSSASDVPVPGTPPRPQPTFAGCSTPSRPVSAAVDVGPAMPGTPPRCRPGGSASCPVSPVTAPGTPTRSRKKIPKKYDEEYEGETEKLRSPTTRSPALRRALMAFGPASAVPAFPSGAAVEDRAVQLQRALRNYEAFHSLPRGTASEEQLAQSSAGVAGWAGPPSLGLGSSDAPPVSFAGSSLAEEMRLPSSSSSR